MKRDGFILITAIIIVVLVVSVIGGAIFYFSKIKGGSAPSTLAEQPAVQKETPSADCGLASLSRQFNNAPYYSGQLIDGHFHMPQMQKISNHPDAPVIDRDVSRRDVACLFSNKDRIKNAFGFYGIPVNLKDQSVEIARDIEKQYPGTISHFIELVSFPGYPVVPNQVETILSANEGLFKGYGEISLYLPFYGAVKPNDSAMKELYKVAEKHRLMVYMHFKEGQGQQEVEEMLRDNPNVQFLFHGMERLPWVNTFFDTLLDKYPNAHYGVDITLFGESSSGRPLLDTSDKQTFVNQFKQSWQTTLNKKVAFWKRKIERHPNQFLWGTDRGSALWHYDKEVASLLEEFSRSFIGQLNQAVQEKYAYKNAEQLLNIR